MTKKRVGPTKMMTDPKAKFGRMVGTRFIDRRNVLRGSGIAMSLPWLSAMQPALAKENPRSPERFVAVTLGLGLVASNLVPEQEGADYQSSLYLQGMEDLRDRYTVFSGVSHPGVKGGHRAEASILTVANGIFRSSEKYNFSRSVSCEVSRK